MMKKQMAGIAAAAALSAAVLSACGQTAANTGGQAVVQTADGQTALSGTITSEGVGTVQVVPDIAEIRISVTTDGTDAKTVKDENTAQYQQVVEFLKAQGIEEKSIQTENVYMSPNYDYSNGQTLIGYTMETSLTVSDIPIDSAGTLIDSAVDAGINGIQSVSYLSSAFDESYQEALGLAVENAQGKAAAIAEAGGVSAGGLVSVTEYAANTSARYTQNLAPGVMRNESLSDAAMDMMPGELEVTARVSASFAVEDGK